MSTLNSYAQMKGKYFHENEIYIGKNMPFSTILKFEKEKGKIIFFSDFKIATETLNNAQRTAIRFLPKQNYDKNGFFSVLFTIKINKENYFQNGIKVGGFLTQEEIILLPFSFYSLEDIQIDYENYSCDIVLKSIGKNGILEEEIKLGKSIKYNEEKNIMEVE